MTSVDGDVATPPEWRASFDDLSVGVARFDVHARLVDCNAAYARILASTPEDLRGLPLADLAHLASAGAREEAELFRRLVNGELRSYETERRIVRMDKRIVWLRLIVSSVRGRDGSVVEVLRLVEDITDVKREGQRMAAQHAVARILADSATLDGVTPQILKAICDCLRWDVGGLWRVDREAQLLRFVDIWHNPLIDLHEFLALTRELTIGLGVGLPGRSWENGAPVWHKDIPSAENFPRADVAKHVGLHGAFAFPIVIAGDVVGVMDFFSREIREPDADMLQMFATLGSQIGQFIERKRAEEDVRALAAQLSEAEDAERRKLARDIHDSIGQMLSVAKMELEGAAHEAKAPLDASSPLARSLSIIDRVIAQTRTLTFDLYPAMLDDLGLVPTLHRYGEQMDRFQVSISETGKRQSIPTPVTNYLFRATKELLNNAAKHSRAKKVLVTIRWGRERLRIMVADDGRGFAPAETLAPQNRRGLGLADIRERIRFLGGQLHIESAPGDGTQVILEVPLGKRAESMQTRRGTGWR